MICFAPLQGYTDAAYRRIHHEVCGGVDEYYTPFVRWEKEGLRRKDLRDIDPANNQGVPVVPQVIAKNRDELARLCDVLQDLGWQRIDLNMGCPFPMQVHAGRGCGLLPRPDVVASLAEEIRQRTDATFSIKMRIGQTDAAECIALLPILNELPLAHITLHPRLGHQQYKGSPDMEAFDRFCEACQQPVLYNGDLIDPRQIATIGQKYPQLKGVMIGRGLLARPWLFSDKEPATALREMHDRLYDHACKTLQGDTQILARLHAFWDFSESVIPHKQYKKIKKNTTLPAYLSAVAEALRQL